VTAQERLTLRRHCFRSCHGDIAHSDFGSPVERTGMIPCHKNWRREAMADRVNPGSAGAPAYADTFDSSQQAPASNNGGSTNSPSGDGGSSGAPPMSDESGLINAGGANGGLDATVDGNDSGSSLLDVHTDALNGVAGDTFDGTDINVVNEDSLVDAQVPGILDATVGDGTVNGTLDGLSDGGLDSLSGDGEQISVEVLNGENVAEANVPGIAEATVGDPGLTGIVNDATETADGANQGITIEALNGENLAEANAPGIADATVGGAELGSLVEDAAATDTATDVADSAQGTLTGDALDIGLVDVDIGQFDDVA
jgi:hypothetical protein